NVAIEPIIYRFPYANLPKLIERLSRVKSFRNAEALMLPLVPHFERFNEAEIEQFVDVCTSNGEIWDAGLCKLNYIPKFISMHRSKIPPEKLAEIEKLISP